VLSAHALVVELDDVAADRVERQRAYARGDVPLPGTPDPATLDKRLAENGLRRGDPVLVRVFKQESELELWMRRGDRFVHFATYPICHWTGTLGPKLREGDKQSPEGFYAVSWRQTRLVGRWRTAFDLGFPNHHDQLLKRSGSHILIHGGCSSVGCYAMTDQVQLEIFGLAEAALEAGQERFQVHIFPFRMTEANLAAHAKSPWVDFWRDLKAGYDSFERTRLPPRIGLCERRYAIADGQPTDGADPRFWPIWPMVQRAHGSEGPGCAVPGGPVARLAPPAEPTPIVQSEPSTANPAGTVPSAPIVTASLPALATPPTSVEPVATPPQPATEPPSTVPPAARPIIEPSASPRRSAAAAIPEPPEAPARPYTGATARPLGPPPAAAGNRRRARVPAAARPAPPDELVPEPDRRQAVVTRARPSRKAAAAIDIPTLDSPRPVLRPRARATSGAANAAPAEPRSNGLGESIVRGAPRIVSAGN
jgi:murein L,D-transpeptidase YafK